MIRLVCDILSQEKFVQFLLVITFLLISSMCANKNNKKNNNKNKKAKKKKYKKDQKSTSSSFSQSISRISKISKKTKKGRKHSRNTENPPPIEDRPKHPGYEAPIEATEDTNTQYQVDNFIDAEDF